MKKKLKKFKLPSMIFLLLVALFNLYPLFYLLFYSLKTKEEIFFTNPFGLPGVPQFSNYIRAFQAFDIPSYFLNSVIVTGVSILCIILIAAPFAYATTRMKWKLRGLASTYIMLGLFIPIQVIIIPISILVRDLHLSNTHLALIIPYVAFNLAFTSMVLSATMHDIPKEMEESACLDGAGIFRIFSHIIMPLSKPAVATGSIFAFLNVWNEYTLASVMITKNTVKTLPVGLSSFVGQRSTDWGAMGASLVLASIPTIVIYLLCSEQVEKALTIGGAVKG